MNGSRLANCFLGGGPCAGARDWGKKRPVEKKRGGSCGAMRNERPRFRRGGGGGKEGGIPGTEKEKVLITQEEKVKLHEEQTMPKEKTK